MLRWIVLGTVVWWIGRTALDGLRRAANRPRPLGAASTPSR